MIGLKFKIKNEYDTILNKILYNIDCSQYKWKIVEEEVLTHSTNSDNYNFFLKDKYTNDEFQKLIKKIHYPIFLNLQMFKINSKEKTIENYAQYLNSDCELIIFILDNEFTEIYVKEQTILEKIYKNALRFDFKNIEFINNKNEVKNIFSAYLD